MTDVNLTELSTVAATVAANHSELQAAVTAERAAQAQLLDAVVECVRPALRALSSKIRTGYRSWWIGTTHTDEESTYGATRGLSVVYEKVGPGRHRPSRDQNRGEYVGFDLYLTSDGRWLELSYDGHWSIWQGEGDEWTATERYMTTAEVAAEWNHDEILASLTMALRAHADGKAPERAKAARERAARIAAIATLAK